MVINNRKINNLENSGVIVPVYRVLNEYEEKGIICDRYYYYSKTLKHHIYFLVKIIFRKILANYEISISNPRDKHLVDKIKEIISILESEKDFHVTTKYFWLDKDGFDFMMNNSYSNKTAHKKNVVERVDTHFYGGGIGLKGLWQEFFDLLTYCYDEKFIDYQLVVAYFEELRELLEMFDSLNYAKYEAGKIFLRNNTPIQISSTVEFNKSKDLNRVLTGIKDEKLYKGTFDDPSNITKTYLAHSRLIRGRLKR